MSLAQQRAAVSTWNACRSRESKEDGVIIETEAATINEMYSDIKFHVKANDGRKNSRERANNVSLTHLETKRISFSSPSRSLCTHSLLLRLIVRNTSGKRASCALFLLEAVRFFYFLYVLKKHI